MEETNIQDRMLHLMEFKNITGKQDKNSISKGSIEYQKKAGDGVNYAIIKEGSKFYLKKEINESFEYISGIRNKEKFSYESIGTAKIELALKIKKINENIGFDEAFSGLNPEKKDNSILNEGKFIRNELNRNNMLIESVEEFANKSTTSPEDDYEETIEVETVGNDSDPNASKNTMAPYVEEVKPVDMERDIEVEKTVNVETAYKEKPKHVSFTNSQIDMIKGKSTPKVGETKTEEKEDSKPKEETEEKSESKKEGEKPEFKKKEEKSEPKKEDKKEDKKEEPKEDSEKKSDEDDDDKTEKISESLIRKITEMVAEKLALKKK